MPRRSTRSRPYERRRRTRRRRQPQQKGGNGDQQALVTWFKTAQTLYDSPPPSAIGDLRRPELKLSLGGGPALLNYYPPYLGDILTNIAVGLGDSIQTYAQFIGAMEFLRSNDKDFFVFMTELEKDLRIFYQGNVVGETDSIPPVNLADQTQTKTPFILIAYANLPPGSVEPRVPVLGDVEDIPSPQAAQAPTPAPPTTNPVAPSLPVQ